MPACRGEAGINDNHLTKSLFAWQEGYGAFSYSKSSLSTVIRYIQDRACLPQGSSARRQEKHHRKRTFIDEYQAFLKAFEIEYDERFIFKEPS